MPQESRIGSGTRLARDMRRIREARHLTVHDLHEETKIPMGLIEAFEESALFDHPQFNRVYLRSFVRTYAQVVGVDADVALEALEEALSDRYSGSLAVTYLGEKPEEAAKEEETPAVPGKPASPGKPAVAGKPAAPGKPDAADEPAETAAPAPTPEPEEPAEQKRKTRDRSPAKRPKSRKGTPPEETKSPTLVSTTADTAAGYERVQEEAAAEEDWTSVSPPGGARFPAERRTARPRDSTRVWLISLGVLVVVAGAIWGLSSLVTNSEEEPRSEVAADTSTVQDTAAASPVAMPPPPALGDTLSVRIVAARDKVDPIRVTVDADLRRPYWLNQGDSMLFRPIDRIVFEEQLDDIDLKVEGVDYPTGRRDELGRLVVTRDSVRNYFATRANP